MKKTKIIAAAGMLILAAAVGITVYVKKQSSSEKAEDAGKGNDAAGIGGMEEAVTDEEGTQEEETGYRKITAEEAKEKMDAGGVTIVDVRTPAEYDEGHVPDAVLVPNESIGETEPPELPDKDAILLVYCRSGRRSKEASDKLAELGYRNVYDFGGILDWPYDTIKE